MRSRRERPLLVPVLGAGDNHVGDEIELGVADLLLDVGGLPVDGGAEACCAELLLKLLAVGEHVVVEAEDADLLRGEPERERGGEMLDQHADEPLHRPERGAMDHHRPVGGVVVADVLQLESFGEVVVELDGAELPLAADRVADHEVGFGTVEGRFSLAFDEWQARLGQSTLRSTRLRVVPLLVRPDVFVRPLLAA